MRVLQFDSKAWTPREVEAESEVRDLAFGPELVWIRATGSTPEEFAHLGELFDLHPLALEDVQNASQRPKVEDYPDVSFVIARVPLRRDDSVEWVQTGIFLGKDFVLTASTVQNPVLDEAERRLLAGRTLRPISSSDSMLYLLLDTIVDAYFPFLHALQDELEDVEDEVLEKASRRELGKIRDLKQEISQTRRVVLPMRETIVSLERGDHPNIQADTKTYLRDVSDHMIRIAEQVEHVKEVALIAQETWNSTLANSQNESMKRLTIVAALLLVPGLLAGIGGMNFEQGFPDWSFPAVTATMFGLVAFGFMFAWWQDWI